MRLGSMRRIAISRFLSSSLSLFDFTPFDPLTQLRDDICLVTILTYLVMITPTTANKCGTTLEYRDKVNQDLEMKLESICTEAYIGNSVKLTCQAKDVIKFQKPRVFWKRPGIFSLSCAPGANTSDFLGEDPSLNPPIENCDTKYRITNRNVPSQKYVKISTLEIKSLSEKDVGEMKYTCEAWVSGYRIGSIEAGLIVHRREALCDKDKDGDSSDNTIVLVCLGVALGLSLLGAGAMALYLLSHRGGGGGGGGAGGAGGGGGLEYGPPTGPASRESLARRSSSISGLRRSRQSSSASKGSSLTSRGSHSRSRSLGGSNIDER